MQKGYKLEKLEIIQVQVPISDNWKSSLRPHSLILSNPETMQYCSMDKHRNAFMISF